MKTSILACWVALGTVVAAVPMLAGQDQPKPEGPQRSTSAAPSALPSPDAGEAGERVFERNCARCHNTPEGFSPRIAGTIVRHMRVRANLSKHDEEVLLHYFNP